VVSVIIINYNTFQCTCRCIESVIAFTKVPFEIILVDNASTECDPSLFLSKFPSIKLIRNPVNNGFAAGNNLGLKEAKGTHCLLLNSDTYLEEDAVGKAFSFLKMNSDIGVLGCRMIYPDGSLQYTARRFRSISWELLDLFRPLLYLLSYKKRASRMLGRYFKGDFNAPCDWLNGAFFMFQKKILRELPEQKLDERFFMYGEDHLWCWQIQQLGYVNYFFSETTVTHISSGSSTIDGQLKNRSVMLHNELEIMRERKGTGIYYFIFWIIFGTKEKVRNGIKRIIFAFSGKLLR
jgi:GT2 family glycosyltransferase